MQSAPANIIDSLQLRKCALGVGRGGSRDIRFKIKNIGYEMDEQFLPYKIKIEE